MICCDSMTFGDQERGDNWDQDLESRVLFLCVMFSFLSTHPGCVPRISSPPHHSMFPRPPFPPWPHAESIPGTREREASLGLKRPRYQQPRQQ